MIVGIVGLGYVGLPLAVAYAEAGHDVIGLDVNAPRVDQLNRGESYIEDIPSERLESVLDHFSATTRQAHLARADAVIVCVPTPLTPNREPDLTPLIDAASGLAQILQAGQLVSVESTTYPGTTRERLIPILEESGLTAGSDFHVAFSPERVDPGREDYTLANTPKIVGGYTEACQARALELYGLVCEQLVPASSLETAEMAKLLENIFRSVNIALVNELGMVADRMAVDIWEVIDAASTKPFGFMRFEPGPGMGGHCLPVDPFYLSWKAREVGITTEFIELAGKVNQHMPEYSVEKIVRALNDQRKSLRGANVLVLGASYKAGVGDIRESPSLKIIKQLQEQGAEVRYHDEFVAELPKFGLANTPLEAGLEAADLAVIVTAHPGIDFAAIAERVPTVDLRGVLRDRLFAKPAAKPRPAAQRYAPASMYRPLNGHAEVAS